MEPSYCLVLDVLGFRATIIAADDTYQIQAVENWVGLVDRCARDAGIDRYQLISDSLFAVAPPDGPGLSALLSLSRKLLDGGVQQQLLVRGAIALGLAHWGERIAHGRAIVDAYELGESCNWVGVACTHSFPHLAELEGEGWSTESVVAYPVPRKNLRSPVRPAVVWSIPSDRELLAAAQPHDSSTVGTRPSLEEPVLAKIRSTLQFRDYLARCRRQSNPDVTRFYPTTQEGVRRD